MAQADMLQTHIIRRKIKSQKLTSYCIALSENTPGAVARWICLADAVQRRGTCIARLPGRLWWCRYLGDWVVQVVLEDVIHRLIGYFNNHECSVNHYQPESSTYAQYYYCAQHTSPEWFENSPSGFWWAISATQGCIELQVLRYYVCNIYTNYWNVRNGAFKHMMISSPHQ